MGFKAITVNTPAEQAAHILAEDDAAIFQGVFGQDGVLNIGGKMAATVISNNKVRVGDGVVVVNGHVGRNAYADYVDLTIENGASGQKRNDLIVARFQTTGSGGLDTFTLAVKKGTAGSTASDPAVTKEDIYGGGKLREYPLYRVKLDGLSITAVEKMFAIIPTVPELEAKVNEINSALTPKITEYTSLKNGWITNGLCCTAVIGKIVFVRIGLKGGTVGTEIELLSGLPKIATGSAVRISGASDVGYNGYAEVKNNSSGVPAIFLRYITSNTNVMFEFFYLTT